MIKKKHKRIMGGKVRCYTSRGEKEVSSIISDASSA